MKLLTVGRLSALLLIGTVQVVCVYGANQKYFEEDVCEQNLKKSNYQEDGAYLKEALKAPDVLEQVSFDDLVGLEEVKQAFRRLVKYLENPESFDRIGATPPKGILLIGGPRLGKSYSIKALATEISRMQKARGVYDDFKFVPVAFSDVRQFGIPYILDMVRRHAPCVIFVDEIDLLNLQRKDANDKLSELLVAMSGTLEQVDPRKPVIFIAATNRPEYLDTALLKPGRFCKILLLESPANAHREEFLRRKLEKLSLNPKAFNLPALARRAQGASYGALELIINAGVLKARLRNQGLTQGHLEEAIDEVLHRIVSRAQRPLPTHEHAIVGAHFAGHALALYLLNGHTKLSAISTQAVSPIIRERLMGSHMYYDNYEDQRLSFGTVITHYETDTVDIQTKDEKLKMIQHTLAGFIAEELLVGSCGYSCHKDDMKLALSLAQSIAFEGLEPGLIKEAFPDEARARRFAIAEQIIEKCKADIRTLLHHHLPELRALSDALIDQQKLDACQVAQIIAEVQTRKLTAREE